MSSCERPELKTLLYRYVRREIEDSGQRQALETHLQECPECRDTFRELEWMMGSLRQTTSEEHEELMRQLRSESPESPRSGTATAARDEEGGGVLRRIKRWLSSGGGH